VTRLHGPARVPILVALRTLALLGLLGAGANAWAQAVQTRIHRPGPFDTVVLTGPVAVRFVQGETDQVVLEGDDDAQRSLQLKVHDGRLSISSGGSWKFWASRQPLTVTARALKRVSITGTASFVAPQAVQGEQLSVAISGSGTVRFDELKYEALKFSVSGSGEGTMSGRVRELGVAVAGRGRFDGEHLYSQAASVAISGVANVSVWASQQLSVAVAGSGSVDYWGSPQVKRSIAGHAELRGHGDKPSPRAP
jgi:Putative auto-transporter adhesin, head GIN domain